MMCKAMGRSGRGVSAAQLSACYALALFHRTSGAVLIIPVAASFGLSLVELSGIAIVFFWVYASLQLPAGIMADVLGSRRVAIFGSMAVGAGAVAFGLASSVTEAMLSRALIAAGCTVSFVSLVRHVKANWQVDRVATITGRGILVGNIGAIVSAAPLALAVLVIDWRTLSVSLGLTSFVLAAAIWCFMSESNEPSNGRERISLVLPQLRCVLANPYNHIGFVILAGLGGPYWALVALWALPMLQSKGVPTAIAVWEISAMMASYAVGAAVLGWLGDRLRSRGRTLSCACAGAALLWLVLVSGLPLPAPVLGLVLLALGFCCGGFNLVFSLVTERNPVEHAGTVTSFVNIGTFTGAAVMQSLGALLATSGGYSDSAMIPMAAAAVVALFLSLALCKRSTGIVGAARMPLAQRTA